MKNIDNRLTMLEKTLTPDPLRVLVQMPDGTNAVMNVDEMIKSGAGFCKVVSGTDMNDLDKILATILGGANEHWKET